MQVFTGKMVDRLLKTVKGHLYGVKTVIEDFLFEKTVNEPKTLGTTDFLS